MRRSGFRQAAWWTAFARDLALLGVESAEVMVRRCMVLGRCDRRAGREFVHMTAEKLAALAELQVHLLSGQLGPDPARTALAHVRRKVRANRARLRR
jgi:hypothetical protein